MADEAKPELAKRCAFGGEPSRGLIPNAGGHALKWRAKALPGVAEEVVATGAPVEEGDASKRAGAPRPTQEKAKVAVKSLPTPGTLSPGLLSQISQRQVFCSLAGNRLRNTSLEVQMVVNVFFEKKTQKPRDYTLIAPSCLRFHSCNTTERYRFISLTIGSPLRV